MSAIGFPFQRIIDELYLPYFNNEGEKAIPFLVNSGVSKMAFLAAYKKLPPIEEMAEREKKEMKQYVIDLFPDKTAEEKIEACKIIYTIGTLL